MTLDRSGRLGVGTEKRGPLRARSRSRHSSKMGNSGGVRRVLVSPDDAESVDFACAYDVDIPPDDERTAEQWARSAWEGASAPLRWFMLIGWRVVLRLRLGPTSSPDHILGWNITTRTDDKVVCQLASSFLSASNTFRRVDGKLVWSTRVEYARAVGRVVWPPISLVHRLLVRVALRRAAHDTRHRGTASR